MSESIRRAPAWLREAGLLSVGFWEPLYFLKYIGKGGADAEAAYERAHSDESLDTLAAAGINLAWTHFFKGFGLEFEAAEMERTRDYIARAHDRGIKVACYATLGSLTPETLLVEEPEANNWFQVNQDGIPPSCQTTFQCFRVRPCYQSEGYLRYMERVCALAIEYGADMIHFDNVGYNPEPDTCHCPVCIAAFRDLLREKYGAHEEAAREAGLARFGHHTFSHVRPPVFNRWNQAINQRTVSVAHQQEWIRFKVHSLTRCIERLSTFIARRNPQCAVEANIFKAPGANTAYLMGIEYDAQLPHLHYAFSEEPARPGAFNKHGTALTRARTFKTARAFGIGVQTYTGADKPELLELNLAENLAFHPYGLGHLGGPLAGYWSPDATDEFKQSPAQQILKKYIDFYRQHAQELLVGTKSRARVAVFRESASLAYNSQQTHRSTLNIEQALLEHNVPFDLLFPAQLDRLADYACVVLANCECLDEATANKLKIYVEAGGGLVATEQTGCYDEWRRLRKRSILSPLFGTAFPAATHSTFGEGRAAYLPVLDHVEEPSTAPEVWYVFEEYWAAPRNSNALLAAIEHCAGAPPLRVTAQSGRPLAEAVETPSGAVAVHVLNLDTSAPLRALEIDVHFAQAPQEVQPISATASYQAIPFEYDEAARRVRFRFDELPRYALFRIK